jgi:hypothetical protein
MKQPYTHLTSLMLMFLLGQPVVLAEQTPNCDDQKNRQFDFWLGNWKSLSAEGKPQGRNKIVKILGGCAIQENWSSGGGKFRGTSYNFYNAAKDSWHQTWIDTTGSSLHMNGGMVDGSMVLSQETNTESGSRIDRITWTPLKDGRVRQHWEASVDDGANWKDVFDGYYEKLDEED